MIVNLTTHFLGAVIFLFIFWKRLKEDYASEIIFRSAFSILIGISIASLISFRFFQNEFLWFGFLGAMAGLGLSAYRYRIRFYESLEALVIAGLPWIAFIFLKNSVLTASLISFIGFLIILIIIFLSYFFDQRYKNFTWYKSGKIGFSGLATLVIIFISRLVVALLQIPVISFLGRFEAVISGIAAFISLILLVNLGRKKE
jgi:hypothetical protein